MVFNCVVNSLAVLDDASVLHIGWLAAVAGRWGQVLDYVVGPWQSGSHQCLALSPAFQTLQWTANWFLFLCSMQWLVTTCTPCVLFLHIPASIRLFLPNMLLSASVFILLMFLHSYPLSSHHMCRPDCKKKAYVRLAPDYDALDVANKVCLWGYYSEPEAPILLYMYRNLCSHYLLSANRLQ